MTTYRFEEIKHSVTKRVPCRVCGKKVVRSTVLSQTVNPFNRDADGNPKAPDQIRAELREQAKAWHPLNDVHAQCTSPEESAANFDARRQVAGSQS